VLPAQMQRLATRGQDREVGDPRQQGIEVRRGGQQALQVVEHEQDRPLPEECRQRFAGILAPLRAPPDDAGDRGQHQGGIGQRRQIDEPDAIGEALRHLLRGGNGQAGLADAPGTDQRQQAHVVLGEEAAHEGQLILPPDQLRRLGREMHREAGRGESRHGKPPVTRRARCGRVGGWSEAGGTTAITLAAGDRSAVTRAYTMLMITSYLQPRRAVKTAQAFPV
jgi:hypothetical protein